MQASSQLWVDDGIADDAAVALYATERMADGVNGFGAVNDEHITTFLNDGYLVINDAFSVTEVDAALNGLLDLIDGMHPDFHGIQFEASAVERIPHLRREEKQDVVRKLAGFVEFDERLAAISKHAELLSVLERIMGEPPDLFQDQALLKPPLIGREKPWHQDNAFFSLPADAMIVGVWLALDEAMPENGCMHIIPGTHRAGPVPHFQRRDWQLCDTDVAVSEVVAVPLKPGGCLLFHGLIHHGTPPSRSPKRRRALQLHYKPVSIGRTSEEERLAVFGADGKGVTC
jgi:phytanoyl-CoA hydroxylase